VIYWNHAGAYSLSGKTCLDEIIDLVNNYADQIKDMEGL
jgi:hypothetical protein